ncbi:MAG TPA: dihydrolipoamide acetyltransferase family protein [Baekduia sp.]|nr:dihydrolipoamide acetyltransferase family protein [Baekduia sp.]
MPDFPMPRLSDTMEEGTILAWLKADGDEIAAGEPLVEVESDKASQAVDAEIAGTLKILVAVGETVAVGVPIATIGGGAEAVVAANGVKASPVARRMARQLGVAIDAIAGTGNGGRITKADVEAAADGGSAPAQVPPPAAPAPAPDSGRGTIQRVTLTRLQETVARRMVQSKAQAPEFLLTVDVDMTEAVRLRGELKALADEGAAVPSLNDFVVRAAAAALARHPGANAAFVDGGVERYGRVNVGIAVAGEGTLLVPTVFDADRKSLGAIASETRRLALAARDGAVTPADLGGGTFTVSNLGMFGIRNFTAVINPPQAAILAVGALEPRPVWDGAAFVPRSMMTMTLAVDHRVLYGADAARFLASIRDALQQPLRLAL